MRLQSSLEGDVWEGRDCYKANTPQWGRDEEEEEGGERKVRGRMRDWRRMKRKMKKKKGEKQRKEHKEASDRLPWREGHSLAWGIIARVLKFHSPRFEFWLCP